MPLSAGSVLGPYEVGPLLGAGGMGEVYRATDTRLGREVAIKVLPDSVAGDEDRRARFEREARVLSQLEHPNVCRLYDIGREAESDTDYLVMELLQGETLRARLDRAPLSEAEATRITIELAEGLDAAHRKGLVHRDLKPGNIMLTDQGTKILDFGLARPFVFEEQQETLVGTPQMAADPGARAAGGESLTAEGVITGTLQYMAPEQAEAKAADRRSDLFALGAIYYEMLTGERAFSGDSPASVIAALMGTPPERLARDDSGLPATPRRVLDHCLARDPDERWQSARDVAIVLRANWGGDPVEAVEDAPPRMPKGWVLVAAVFAALGLGWVGASLFGGSGERTAAEPASIQLRQQTRLDWDEFAPQISPDGQFFVFTADSDDTGPEQTDIYLQRIDGDRPIRLTDHPGGDWSPAFSPDGDRIAFCSDREANTSRRALYVMGSTGESVRKLADEGCWPSWSPDGTSIAYSTGSFSDPRETFGNSEIHRVDLATGETRVLVSDVQFAMQPAWSPDGRQIAFWGLAGGNRDLYLHDLSSGETRRVTTWPSLEWSPTWAPDGGDLYFSSDRSGVFNLWRLTPQAGEGSARLFPLPVGDVWFPSFSKNGERLLFARRIYRASLIERPLGPDGRLGAPRTLLGGNNVVVNPQLSPDGSQVVFFGSVTEDLFLFDIATARLRRLTDDDQFHNRHPQWTETGWILYSSDREGSWDVWAIRPDGSDRTRLTESSDPEFLGLWAPRIRQAWIRTITGDPLVRPIEEDGAAGPPRLGPATPAPTCQGSRFFSSALSPDGNRVVGFSSCGQAQSAFWIHDLASGSFTHLFPLLPYASPCWIDDDRLVLPGRDIVVVETSGEVLYREPVSPTDPIQLVRCNVTPDGTRLIMNAYSIESDVWLAELGGVE